MGCEQMGRAQASQEVIRNDPFAVQQQQQH